MFNHHLLTSWFRHWQLRSQIGSSSSKRYVYYVGGNGNTQVHKLDTAARESEIVKILTFAPRCLVAKNGWICCGGENGEFVAFPVNEGAEDSDRNREDILSNDPSLNYIRNYIESGGPRSDMLDAFRDHLSADDRLQIGLEINSDDTTDSIPALNPTSPRPDSNNNNKSLVARSKTFGKERVNCITLWFPPSLEEGKHNGTYSQSVAVLANNDKNVTIVDLENQEAVEEVDYPDCVNRALISPDGRLLVAICDDPYLYVHQRVPKQAFTPGLFTRRDLNDYEWRLGAKIHLVSQRKEDRTDQRGSFAACFSNTGRYLAVGTQYGVISVFDTAVLLETGFDPLIATFTSSRPRQDVGAIRDMAFCPGPFDLLAWTEHRGRVGIADIRSNYVSRQILDLDVYDDFEQIMVTERGSIDPRLLERNDRGELALAESAEGSSRRLARRFTTDYHSPLSAEETLVLEALSEHRRRRDQAAATRNSSSPGTSTMRLLNRLQNQAAQMRESAAYRESRNNSRVSDILGEIYAQRERLRDQSERLREQSERVRARRLAADETELSRLARGGATPRTAPRTPMALPQQNTQSTRQSSSNNLDTDLADLYQNTFEAHVMGSDLNVRIEAAGDNERASDRAHLASVWSTLLRQRDVDSEAPASRLARARMADRVVLNMASRPDREHDDTAGLAWSEDGRIL